MREQITGKQGRLEEHHAGVPDLRCPSKLWQEDLGHHRLEHEQQECTREEDDGKERNGVRAISYARERRVANAHLKGHRIIGAEQTRCAVPGLMLRPDAQLLNEGPSDVLSNSARDNPHRRQ